MAQSKPVAASSKQALSTNNFILVSVLITLLVGIGSGFIANKLIKQAVLNNKVISKKSVASKQLEDNISIISNLQQQYASMGGKSQLVLAALPTQHDFPALVSMLEVVAGVSGVKLKSVIPTVAIATPAQTETTSSGSTPQPYQFGSTIEGSYDNVLKFLGNIELSARPVKVISFQQTGSSTLQAVELNFETYYQGPADLTPKTEVVK